MPTPAQAPPVYRPNSPRTAALPVYRPQAQPAQPKQTSSLKLENRPAPPVYRPQQSGASSTQTKSSSMVHSGQPQAHYELTSPVWIREGCQQIRVKVKGSSTPVGSVDLHYREGGKAYISDLEVAQGHRRHGLGTMLMKAAMDAARRTGRTSTELEANPGPGSISKQSLVGMYEKLGFRNTGFSRRGNPKMTIQGKLNHQPCPLFIAPI